MATTMRTVRTIDVEALPVSTRRSTRRPVVVNLEPLLERPGDPDDLVAALRFSIAWSVDGGESVDDLARRARVGVDRLAGFLRAPARSAGELLTLAEVSRLARVLELRVVELVTIDEADAMRAIAGPYLEVAMADGVGGAYRRAVRTAEAVRAAHRARHPDADRFAS